MSIYETHIMKNPQLPFIFHKKTRLRSANRSHIQPNWHENIEIIYVTHGSGTVACDTEHLHVRQGDFIPINSNCMHSIYTEDELFIYHCLIVDRSFCLSNHFDTNEILFTPTFRDPELEVLMLALEREYTPPYRTEYRVQMIRALVLQIMARLCCEHSVRVEGSHADTRILSCIKQAIGFIRSQSDRDISLDDAADFVGLSKYYFAREFRRVTGHTFVSYVNLIRCEKAKVMLTENRLHIGEIGRACGFENQSYFTRIFRNYTGMLPSTYRETHLSAATKATAEALK